MLDRYWDICLLRESPENTPYSIVRIFMSGVFLALIMAIEWNYAPTRSGEGTTVLVAACLMLSYVIYTYVVLSLRGLTSRLVQTVTALFCTSIIIHILVLPLLLITPYLEQTHLKNPMLLLLGVIYLFLSIGLSVWQFVIVAHIYKYALNTTPIQSVLVAFGLIAANILTVSSLQ